MKNKPELHILNIKPNDSRLLKSFITANFESYGVYPSVSDMQHILKISEQDAINALAKYAK